MAAPNYVTASSKALLEKKQYVQLSNSRSLWNPWVHCRAHKSSPTVRVVISAQTPKPNIPMIHLNFTHPPTPGSSSFLFPFMLTNQTVVLISHLPQGRYMPRPTHPP
jgi:hypothetical protein